MKKLVWLACVILASCSTVHKNISTVKKTEDSVTVSSKDTTSVSTQVKHNDNFTAKGVHITVTYNDTAKKENTSDTVKWTPLYVNKKDVPSSDKDYVEDIVGNMVKALPTASQIPYSVSIDIDSFSNQTTTSINRDSTTGSHKDSTNVNTKTDSKDKVVSRTGLGAGVYIILGAVILLFLFIAAIKFKWL